ncbi:MAG: hypothetical protein VXX85_00860 [Candidatus Margulisiibacteriota bacterium]|nr:hypothetical protein [Candidatus Margulisiibacteriota bacterium]
MDLNIKNVVSHNCINEDVVQALNKPYQPKFIQGENVNELSKQQIINKVVKKLVKKIMGCAINKVCFSTISQNQLQPIKPNTEPKSNKSPLNKRAVRFKEP